MLFNLVRNLVNVDIYGNQHTCRPIGISSFPNFTSCYWQQSIPYHLLKYQLKHKVSKWSNVYQRLCSLYFESLAIFSLFRHIHKNDDPDFQHAYNRTYLFLSDNDILYNESRFLFDHGIISSWNFWHYRGNKLFTKFAWSQIIHLSSILSKFWDGCLHLN